MLRRLLVGSLLAATVLHTPLARAADPAESTTPPDLSSLALGNVLDQARRGDVLYVAPDSGGVVVIDVSDPAHPKVIERLLAGRAISSLMLSGERMVALVVSEEAVSFSIANPQAPLVALPTLGHGAAVTTSVAVEEHATPAPAKIAQGKVVAVADGRAIFDGGGKAGFKPGARVRVISQKLVQKPDLRGNSGVVMVPSGETTAVVAVEDVEADRAMAILGRGDVALVGDLVESTDEPVSERIFLPRRAPFTWALGFHTRPFLGIGGTGYPIGVLTDGYVHYTFANIPLSLQLEVAPMGFTVLSQDLHYPGALSLGASYVTDYFEIGLGGGALVGNAGPCVLEPTTPGAVTTKFTCTSNTGPTFNQMLRLGAVDGIHLAWASSIFARGQGFVLGVGRGELTVPVSSRLGIFGSGGFGVSGWAFGEIGVRSLFGGTGGPGTTILSVSLGGAGIFDGAGKKTTNPDGSFFFSQEFVAGPSVGFGMEWRL